MDQKELREIENRCIQEEPAWCMAECPLHVDVRLFLKKMAEGKWDAARKVLDKTMPFPGILGRICDHPCEKKCKRGEVDAPVAISELERACVTFTASLKKVMLLPDRGKRVAVIGSGLSSLTAAWDLIRKGYGVAIFEPGSYLGGSLWNLPHDLLPKQIIGDETALLQNTGVRINLKAAITPERFEEMYADFDAVYIGQDNEIACDFGLAQTPSGRIRTDDVTRAASRKGVFAGGIPEDGSTRPSPVLNAAQGRWAATSADRYIQNVSMTAARPHEGPMKTRLYTDITGIPPLPRTPVSDPEEGYDKEAAIGEAGRCLQCECMECVKACPYLEHYKSYPKSYARQIYNNLSIVKGDRKANTLINSCSLCRLCETVCPESFSMADLCHNARQEMVRVGKMPPSAHEFALLDMAFSNSDKCALARHAPGESGSAWLFFPGCQLSGSAPGHVTQSYSYLREKLGNRVGLMLGCCGAPAHWGGDAKRADAVTAQLKAQWTKMGHPRPVLACSSCMEMFRKFLPEADPVSLWEIMAREGLPETALNARAGASAVAVIDPCTARHDTGVQESVRHILRETGFSVAELDHSREMTECCGFGGLMANANPDMAREVIRRRAGQSPLDYVAYCAVCRDHLATTGKRTAHLLDYIWPDEAGPDPAERKNPGYSLRHENRARLREKLLSELWGEKTEETDACEKIVLHISDEVRDRLEDRRILTGDIQKVLFHVQNGGAHFKNPKTGHWLAVHRPLNVTFWVEYAPSGQGFEIYNAYCHRMIIVEEGK
ncbi:hypothetical protein DENIS_0373 [Desulfonema ishimotonii]|uniref:4Fe-4S ferredoxin-type domain-containing protein n=1 Tax=Desulfonema ishimotonii TaxID=45657 RepID=A0A401FR49_9BACT|nr:pyridine nucleotide-disulfide oxidoreductase/dicluster-binding protein [Desulfonema ishimotonii]GBC59434.1 hypothetical protein DENIS_0373 [Desulfonema ishimotonii]